VSRILIPANEPEDWRHLLADPQKHWRRGYSARALAHCWQEADGIPAGCLAVLARCVALQDLETLIAIPEHRVPLPGGKRPSQNDVWVLARTPTELVSIAVEGKVSEPFGPTLDEWFEPNSLGQEVRLRYLCRKLELTYPPPADARYQLFHRAASAVIEAEWYHASHAVLLIHSFSPTNSWFDDYVRFLELFGVSATVNAVASRSLRSLRMHFAWVQGEAAYLEA